MKLNEKQLKLNRRIVKLVSKLNFICQIEIFLLFLEQKSKPADNDDEDSDAEDPKTHVHDDEL